MEHVKTILKSLFMGFIWTIPTIIVGSVVIFNCVKRENKAIEEYPVKIEIEIGYTCYYNGEEIDPDNEKKYYIYIADK